MPLTRARSGQTPPDLPPRDGQATGVPAREAGPNSRLERLRREVRRIEGTGAPRFSENERASAPDRLPLGVAVADRALGGGLPLRGMTELRAQQTRDSGTAAGFALALAVLLKAVPQRPVLWIGEAAAYGEGGDFYHRGLAGLGLDPGAVLFVRARRLTEAVWAGEEAARSGGLSLVVLEARGNPRLLGLEGTRRLHLRAAGSGMPLIFLRQAGEAEPTAAPFRLRIAPSPSAGAPGTRLIGSPAFSVALEKSPDGRPTRFVLEWNDHEHRFETRSRTLSRAFASPAVDRPDLPAEAGRFVALRRAS